MLLDHHDESLIGRGATGEAWTSTSCAKMLGTSVQNGDGEAGQVIGSTAALALGEKLEYPP
jgi:hypothetical protein